MPSGWLPICLQQNRVVRTHASWRDMPLEFGKWETAYKRYRLRSATGL